MRRLNAPKTAQRPFQCKAGNTEFKPISATSAWMNSARTVRKMKMAGNSDVSNVAAAKKWSAAGALALKIITTGVNFADNSYAGLV
mmetsp:Transcript_39154/g.93767  ORF Transcript_39154/g.93767 Transcript_39154/m.93767 type:complete len:86 (+) Transcript_39154:478-735(+)